MNRRLFLAVAVVVWVLGGMRTAWADDLKAMEGKWTVETAEADGKVLEVPELRDLVITITGELYEVRTRDGMDAGSLKLDETAKPKAMDATDTEGENVGKVIRAIYELTGDTLRVCYALNGGERPKDFAAPEGSPFLLITYRREK